MDLNRSKHLVLSSGVGVLSGRCRVVGTLAITALLVACSNTPKDETAAWTPEKLYAEAKDEMSAGNFERAGVLFERLEGRATGTLLSQQAQLERAFVMYRGNEKAQALSILERFIKLHPTSPALDYALYLQGLVNFNDNLGILGSLAQQDLSERDQQASRDSYQSFKQLVEQFPQSRYAADAQLRMNYILNALADYEVHVARYYYRRGAYVAAVNRAQQTVTDFQRSPATEEALAIMVRSYDQLGMTDLRDDARRVLTRNFPNSAFLRPDGSVAGVAAAPKTASRWWKLW
jgi:outer membrane protein assembly factor BamD